MRSIIANKFGFSFRRDLVIGPCYDVESDDLITSFPGGHEILEEKLGKTENKDKSINEY